MCFKGCKVKASVTNWIFGKGIPKQDKASMLTLFFTVIIVLSLVILVAMSMHPIFSNKIKYAVCLDNGKL